MVAASVHPEILESSLSNLVPIWLLTVAAKFGSLPSASANSTNVSKAAGALSTIDATFQST